MPKSDIYIMLTFLVLM